MHAIVVLQVNVIPEHVLVSRRIKNATQICVQAVVHQNLHQKALATDSRSLMQKVSYVVVVVVIVVCLLYVWCLFLLFLCSLLFVSSMLFVFCLLCD